MDPLTMMFLAAVIPSMFGVGSSLVQQGNEYNAQKKLLDQQQQFSAQQADLAWERSRPGQIYTDYLDLGFNPNLAAQAVMGGNAETAQAGQSTSAPTVNSAIDAISRNLGGIGKDVNDAVLKNAQIQNLNANTNKTDIEAGILPRDYQLRSMTTEAQIKLWNKSVDKMCSEIGFTDEQKRLVEQQNLFYGRMSEAEIQAKQAQASEAFANASLAYQKIKESKKSMEVMDADVALKHAQTSNVIQDTSNKIIEGDLDYQRSERERIAKEFETKMNGIPLSVDGQKYVHSLIVDGKFEEAQEFYNVVFQSALNQNIGTEMAKPNYEFGLPFGILKTRHKINFENQMPNTQYGLYGYRNIPYWTPH